MWKISRVLFWDRMSEDDLMFCRLSERERHGEKERERERERRCGRDRMGDIERDRER